MRSSYSFFTSSAGKKALAALAALASGQNPDGTALDAAHVVTFTPTLTVGPYEWLSCIGGQQAVLLADFGYGAGSTLTLEQLTLTVPNTYARAAMRLIFFAANPAASTFADGQVTQLAAADRAKVLTSFRWKKQDYSQITTEHANLTLRHLNMPLPAEGANLYFALVTCANDEQKFQPQSASDLTLRLYFK